MCVLVSIYTTFKSLGMVRFLMFLKVSYAFNAAFIDKKYSKKSIIVKYKEFTYKKCIIIV